MIKKIILSLLVVMSFGFTIKTKAALTPNVDYPVNLATNNWTEPVITYNGQYVTSLTKNTATGTKNIAISIPMQDVMYFTFTYYDQSMNLAIITSLNSGFNHYEKVLFNAGGQPFDIFVQELQFEPVSWKLEVYTVFNFTAGGGNTATWKNNIQQFAYVSQSPLYGQLNLLSEIIYKSAYDKGYQEGEADGYVNGGEYWTELGYQRGLADGNVGFNAYTALFAIIGNIFSYVFTIEIAPGLYTGYIAGFFILIGLMGILFSIKGGKKH